MTSPKTARRLTRILSMLPWVIAHPGATVEEVCTRFDYTKRELAEELNLVFVCGLPGYGPGDLMDAYIDEDEVVVDTADYFSASPRLAPAEVLTLLASGMALLSSGMTSEALTSGVDKLQRALMPEGEESLSVELAAEPGLVPELRRAAAQGRVVRLTYTGLASGETTERDVEPWSVFSTLGNWYLSAHCRLAGEERLFRIDRIRSVEPTTHEFVPPETPPPPIVRYSPGEEDVHATIRLGPAAAWVAEYYPVEVVAEDESTVVRFSASEPAVAARLLLRLGSDAELLEGREVAETLADMRARILERYRASPS